MIRLARELDAAHLAELRSDDAASSDVREPAPPARQDARPQLTLLAGGGERG